MTIKHAMASATQAECRQLAEYLAAEQYGKPATEKDIVLFEQALRTSQVLIVATGKANYYRLLVTWSQQIGRVPNHIEEFSSLNGKVRRLPHVFRYNLKEQS